MRGGLCFLLSLISPKLFGSNLRQKEVILHETGRATQPPDFALLSKIVYKSFEDGLVLDNIGSLLWNKLCVQSCEVRANMAPLITKWFEPLFHSLYLLGNGLQLQPKT